MEIYVQISLISIFNFSIIHIDITRNTALNTATDDVKLGHTYDLIQI